MPKIHAEALLDPGEWEEGLIVQPFYKQYENSKTGYGSDEIDRT